MQSRQPAGDQTEREEQQFLSSGPAESRTEETALQQKNGGL